MTSQKPLVTNPSYTTPLTRILAVLFPDDAKEITQHHLNTLGALGVDQTDAMTATFDSPKEYEKLWNSGN